MDRWNREPGEDLIRTFDKSKVNSEGRHDPTTGGVSLRVYGLVSNETLAAHTYIHSSTRWVIILLSINGH